MEDEEAEGDDSSGIERKIPLQKSINDEEEDEEDDEAADESSILQKTQ